MDRQTVLERKARLDGSVEDFVCEALLVEPGRRAVLRYVLERMWRVGNRAGGETTPVIELPAGTRTIAHYWIDRPYNVYHWIDLQNRTLGMYFNAADRTVVTDGLVAYRDLAIDVFLRPDGTPEVLDEDELPSDLEPAARKTVAAALEAVTTNGRRLAAEIEAETRRLL